jgi:hypothetical protein
MEASFAAQDWPKALALIVQLLAIETDPKEADTLRRMREEAEIYSKDLAEIYSKNREAQQAVKRHKRSAAPSVTRRPSRHFGLGKFTPSLGEFIGLGVFILIIVIVYNNKLVPYPVANAPVPGPPLTVAVLCLRALDPDETIWNWDARPAYRYYVAEAQRRGLTIDECRSAIGWAPPPAVSALTITSADLTTAPPSSIAWNVGFTSGRVGDVALLTVIGTDGIRYPCRRIVQKATGHFWCTWNEIGVGKYRMEIRVIAHGTASGIPASVRRMASKAPIARRRPVSITERMSA